MRRRGRALRRRYGHANEMHDRELVLFDRWMRARKNATRPGAKGRAAYAIVDKLQYELQDMSPFGYSLVWGEEGRKRGVR